MFRLLMRQRRLTAAFPLATIVNAVLPASSYAHVKWFCAFDVAGQPRGLENVLCPDFEFLVGLTILALMAGCLVEGTELGDAMLRSMDRATAIRARQHRNDVSRRRAPSSSSRSGRSAASC